MQSIKTHKHKPRQLVHVHTHTHTHTHTLPGRFFQPFIFYLFLPTYRESIYNSVTHWIHWAIQIQRHVCAHTFLHGHIYSVSRDDFPSSSDLWQYLGSSDTSAQGCFLSLHLLCKKFSWPKDLLNVPYLFLSSRKVSKNIPIHQPS